MSTEKSCIVHYTIRITGKVQGVFYRASTKKVADRLNIKGWVSNQPDGSVLIAAEGEAAQMQSLIEWCHQGPESAQVSEVVCQEKPLEGFQDFTVKR